MAMCLIALGSNLGNREVTLHAALSALDVLPETRLSRHSRWYRSLPIGIAASRREFLNGTALVDTALDPQTLLECLQRIETEHGRRHEQQWADRTLDLDLLLYNELVLDTPALMIPHPRMSFRRFMLEPAAEIAGTMPHPTIGWSIDQLLRHLDSADDLVAILSPGELDRRPLVATLTSRFAAQVTSPRHLEEPEALWPRSLTTWLRFDGGPDTQNDPTAADGFPKLTILWDDTLTHPPAREANWDAVVRQSGRGPTLLVRTTDLQEVEREVVAAVQAVWPHLGP